MSGAGPTLHTPDWPPWSVFKFPPDSAPPPITNPSTGEATFANPFHIPQETFQNALSYKVPLAIASVYAVTVTYLNWYNRQHGNKPWRIAKTRPFFAFVVLHNIFLAVYSAVTCVAMIRALKHSIPHYTEPNAVVGAIDALCKIHGPRGLGDAVTYNATTNLWASKNSNILVDSAGLPDASDVGRIWNEGLAFWGWWFYLSKFYEVLDTAIILAKGKRSTTLQKYHHAGAMLSMWAGMRFMSPAIWMFALVNSGIHALMYTYYTVSAFGYRVPNAVKRTLTTLQIMQFLVGTVFAACHLFISYTVPVSIAHQFAEKVARKADPSSISSAVTSATSSVAEALPTATGAAVAFLRKLIYRAAGDEGLAENIAVPGHPIPHYQQQQLLAAGGQRPEHPIEHFFHHPHETVNRVVYRTEYQSVPCIDTSGQAFAVYLNMIYLAPLTILFMRFFFKSYLRRTSPNKQQSRHTAITDATRDATHGVEKEVEDLGKAAEDSISSAVNRSRDAIRGRKTNANGVAKDERHGSLSPANKKFVDNVTRKVNQRLQEIGEGADNVLNKAKDMANDVLGGAADTKEKVKDQANSAKENAQEKSKQAGNKVQEKSKQTEDKVEKESEGLGDDVKEKAKQTKDDVQEGSKEAKDKAEKEAKPYADAAKDKAKDAKDNVKKEADNAQQQANGKGQGQQQSQKDNNKAGNNKNQSNDNKQSKLPQKKKERKETEESGVLVKKEDAEEPTDDEVAKPEKEPEPKDLKNTLDDDEGKGLF